MKKNSIQINGFNIGTQNAGRNIVISSGKVIIDGVDCTPESKNIVIHITGDIDELSADSVSNITISGNANIVKTLSGDVDVEGDIKGSVQTMSGDVDCKNVHGSVSTMSGDIKQKK